MKSSNHEFKYGLLSHVKDSITGFEGVIVRCAQYLTGCDRYAVQPKKLNKTTGLPVESEWFEEWRLEPVNLTSNTTLVSNIPLGATAIDKVTLFTGIVVCRTMTPGANNRISLVQKEKAGAITDKPLECWRDFDELSLTLKGTKVIELKPAPKQKPGGPNSIPAPKY